MKLNVNFKGILISASEKPYKLQNGGTGTSYSLGLECSGEVGNVKCTESVFNQFKSGAVPKYSTCDFAAVYDTDYKNMSVDSVMVVKTK